MASLSSITSRSIPALPAFGTGYDVFDIHKKDIGLMTTSKGTALSGKAVSQDKEIDRLALNILGEDPSFQRIAIQRLPADKEQAAKMIASKAESYWVPLKLRIWDEKGKTPLQEEIVLVDINSLEDRVGLSKTVAKGLTSSDGTALARVLNKIQVMQGSNRLTKKEAIKVANFIEENQSQLMFDFRKMGQGSPITRKIEFIPTGHIEYSDKEILIVLLPKEEGAYKTCKGIINYTKTPHRPTALINYKVEHIISLARAGEYGKFTKTDPDFEKQIACYVKESMERELRFCERFKDAPGLAITHEVDLAGNRMTQHLYGSDLSSLLINKKYKTSDTIDFQSDEILKILQDAITGLYILHSSGCAHRDIKPQNMFVDIDPATKKVTRLAIGDLGSLTDKQKITDWIGNMVYISPEKLDFGCQKLPDSTFNLDSEQSNDIWALGLVMYQAITGASLEVAKRAHWGGFFLEGMLSKLPGKNPIERLIRGMLEFDKTKRWTIRKIAEFLKAEMRIDVITPAEQYLKLQTAAPSEKAVKLETDLKVKREEEMTAGAKKAEEEKELKAKDETEARAAPEFQLRFQHQLSIWSSKILACPGITLKSS